MLDINLVYTLGGGLLGGGIAWGGVVQSIKGVKETQAEVKVELGKHIEADNTVQKELLQAVARIEGLLEAKLK